jgi:stage II sporulation protein D
MAALHLGAINAWATLPPTVRVQLFSAHPEIQEFTIKGPVQVIRPTQKILPDGRYQLDARQGYVRLCRKNDTKTCFLRSSQIALKAKPNQPIRLHAAKLAERQYPGTVLVRVDKRGRLYLSNELPTTTYVALVISSETLPNWPQEALKAQAVLTQTRLSRYHPTDILLDSTQQEAYLGLRHQHPLSGQAVAAVWGEVLTYHSRPITPFYHASCGGHTSDGRFFNPQKHIPWLTGIRCDYCRNAPFYRPTVTTISNTAFHQHFPDGLPRTTQTDAAGRPLYFRLGNRKRTGYQFWLKLGQTLGWDKAPGTRFSITRLPDGNYQARSTGAGHGVGLCQWGAAEMARKRKNYRQILQFYFPKAQLSKSG